MYHTPRSRVRSRRSARKDEEPIEGQSSPQELPILPPSLKAEVQAVYIFFSASTTKEARTGGGRGKGKDSNGTERQRLRLAEIDDECSVRSDYTNKEVEERLERRHRELEAQPVHDQGQTTDVPCAPLKRNAGIKGTVQLLASTLKDLTAASTSNNLNSNLLSRICTPKDLPLFCGDPMEWIHFKQAYEESTKILRDLVAKNVQRRTLCTEP
ncbi:unnamed protein product [Arctia plantaginis]|uniref:Uncharacterized protein n=1 Tax=Arctia plantaginis TaxID=874455 RepID=A0A8S1BI41_ARCPL|nr:unnamed protein product [Arctia plantaginis]